MSQVSGFVVSTWAAIRNREEYGPQSGRDGGENNYTWYGLRVEIKVVDKCTVGN